MGSSRAGSNFTISLASLDAAGAAREASHRAVGVDSRSPRVVRSSTRSQRLASRRGPYWRGSRQRSIQCRTSATFTCLRCPNT